MSAGTEDTLASGSGPVAGGSDALAVGSVLADRFVVETQLGSGGMGVVYRAIDRVLGRPVAIKVLRPEYRNHAELVDRFLNEARIVASLFTNPNIVNIYDLGRSAAGDPYLVMEFLRGKSLRDEIDPKSAMKPSRSWVLDVLSQIAAALVDAHASGVAHRDLKPENVFLINTHMRLVKVLDFGLAVSSSAPRAEAHRTQPGALIGTPAYMAPEVIRGEAVGAAADVYALGIMLFELATSGQLPYDAKTLGQWMRAHELDSPKQFPDLRYPQRIGEMFAAMLAKDPQRRPPIAAVRRELAVAAIEIEEARKGR